MKTCPLCAGTTARSYLNIPGDACGQSDYFQCDICDLIFLEPSQRLNKTDEKSRYDLHQNHIQDQGYVDFLNRLLKPLREYLPAGAKGLDFGCGPGPAVRHLLSRAGFEVDLFDPFYYPDPGWENKIYDFITCTEVLEHLFEPGRVLTQLTQALRNGGVLGIMTQLTGAKIDFADWWYRKDPTHVCFYSRKSFDWIARKFGVNPVYPAANIILLIKK